MDRSPKPRIFPESTEPQPTTSTMGTIPHSIRFLPQTQTREKKQSRRSIQENRPQRGDRNRQSRRDTAAGPPFFENHRRFGPIHDLYHRKRKRRHRKQGSRKTNTTQNDANHDQRDARARRRRRTPQQNQEINRTRRHSDTSPRHN